MKPWLSDRSDKLIEELQLRRGIAHAGELVPCHAVPPEWRCNVCGRQLVQQEIVDASSARRALVFGVPPGTEIKFPAALENGALIDFVARVDDAGAVGEFYRAESLCRREA
jgi:hypothetical protein